MAGEHETPLQENGDAVKRMQKQHGRAALEECLAACERQDLNEIKEYFAVLDDPSAPIRPSRATTLLSRTVEKNWIDGARWLLEQGLDPNKLFLARIAECCLIPMLQLLVEFGIDYRGNPNRENMLVYALKRREILDWLLAYGLDINLGGNGPGIPARQPDGRMHVLSDNTVGVLNGAAALGDIDLFDYLVARGAKPTQSNALHHAAGYSPQTKSAAMIVHLVEKYDFDVNADDGCGGLNEVVKWRATPRFPLGYAVEKTRSNLAAAEVLLRYGADVRDIHLDAIENRDAPMLKLLLRHGADPSEGLGWAIIKDYPEGARICLEHGADVAKGKAMEEERARHDHYYNGMSEGMRQLLDEAE